MKTLITLFLLLSYSFYGYSQNWLDNLSNVFCNNKNKKELLWESWLDILEIEYIGETTKIGIVDFRKDRDLDKIEYLFVNDTLRLYSVIYKNAVDASLFMENYGIPTRNKNTYIWESSDCKVYAHHFIGSNVMIISLY